MKKIPTLFERIYENHKVAGITEKVTAGMEWVLQGEGVATIKFDGSCCAFIKGEFYKRYDCRKGRTSPEGFIPCCEPDPITGHWPGWVKCDRNNPDNKWFWAAYDNCSMLVALGATKLSIPSNHESMTFAELEEIPVTYEAYGEHFNGNPYDLKTDGLYLHGGYKIEVERTFEDIKKYLFENRIEGIVFWKDGEPQCKIKRSDFGFEWNNK